MVNTIRVDSSCVSGWLIESMTETLLCLVVSWLVVDSLIEVLVAFNCFVWMVVYVTYHLLCSSVGLDCGFCD